MPLSLGSVRSEEAGSISDLRPAYDVVPDLAERVISPRHLRLNRIPVVTYVLPAADFGAGIRESKTPPSD